MNIEQLLKDKKGTIVDVRADWEFQGGHVVGSVNIPLHELHMRGKKQPVYLTSK